MDEIIRTALEHLNERQHIMDKMIRSLAESQLAMLKKNEEMADIMLKLFSPKPTEKGYSNEPIIDRCPHGFPRSEWCHPCNYPEACKKATT